MEYQRMNGTLVPAILQIDTASHRIALADASGPPSAQPKPLGTFTFQQSAPDRLHLDGELDGHPVAVTLEQVPLSSFPLRGTGFHWIREGSTR
jgi:hypothetical protein